MYGAEIDLESNSLCLIDSAITSLQDVPLRPHLTNLNLHSNHIERIEKLSHLTLLKHLDLSSNQISRIEGLNGLVSLKSLNLACNHISRVEGLERLNNLERLNLSYNNLTDITCLQLMYEPQYKLSHIDLHGNNIQSIDMVTQSLAGCTSLRHLYLQYESADNPVCYVPNYHKHVMTVLPQLISLDGLDQHERPMAVTVDNVLADIPGIEDFMDVLKPPSSTDAKDVIKLATPNIDTVLEKFRSRGASTPELTSNTSFGNTTSSVTSDGRGLSGATTSSSNDLIHTPPEKLKKTDHEERLEKLEQQLAEYLTSNDKKGIESAEEKTKKSNTIEKRPVRSRYVAKRDCDVTDESDVDSAQSQRTLKNKKTTGIPSLQKGGRGSQRTAKPTQSMSEPQYNTRQPNKYTNGPQQNKRQPISTKVNTMDSPSAIAQDDQQRRDIEDTYVQLMKEVESERERRWKAEQAARKLVEHIQKLQTSAKEEHDVQDIAIQATTRLKHALTNEREAKLRLQDDLDATKKQLEDVSEQLKASQKHEEEQRRALRALETTSVQFETKRIQESSEQAKKVQQAQLQNSATQREAELLRTSVKSLKGQLQQMQELLADREQEHRKELSQRYSLGSPELQGLISKEVARVESRHIQELQANQNKIANLTQQYNELEDEFRMGLQVEANRFNELQTAYKASSTEAAENRQALVAAQKKDEKTSNIVTELTALVKEQKARITELAKTKQEQVADMKERLNQQDAHLEEARKRLSQMEFLKQENKKLVSKNHALESVIEGLRSERKLWSEELAQQGSSLAQDRGRLESKIEALTQETQTLRKQLDREVDGMKIKSKMIDDQTETIRKLKEGLSERDNDVKKAREESLKIQQDLEAQLAEESTAYQDAQNTIEKLQQRKEDLKEQLMELQAQLEDSQKAHGILNKKWTDKSSLIGRLEEQVQGMKTTWENKEKTLTEERDKAVQAAESAVEKLKSLDNAFRKQLDAKESSHQIELDKLTNQKQEELNEAYRRIMEVEDEMRALLAENESNKKAMDDRIRKLTQGFTELQQDLIR
ncbi:unnamed protein product [Owenia fusiformis]|uniref:Leucine-rich repeat and coiled-coil domain-containing protein 1 n=1 Tax=Owenia fusiformis TaxID=6347 RepID=A0A8J1XHZ1_OWEFU|nr:unnamed protein product [Owenia fusiformis]